MQSHKLVPLVSIGIFILAIAGYALFRFSPLFLGPSVTVVSPSDGTLVTEPYIDLVLETKRVSELHVNGLQIFIEADGETIHRLYLEEGVQTIIVDAYDLYDAHKQIQFSILKRTENIASFTE